MFAYLFFDFLCAGIAALLASQRNRNVVGWFFLGILIGPFAPIFVLIAGQKDLGKPLSDILHGPVEAECPLCKEMIKVGALKCKHCGEIFETPIGDLEQPPTVKILENNAAQLEV